MSPGFHVSCKCKCNFTPILVAADLSLCVHIVRKKVKNMKLSSQTGSYAQGFFSFTVVFISTIRLNHCEKNRDSVWW